MSGRNRWRAQLAAHVRNMKSALERRCRTLREAPPLFVVTACLAANGEGMVFITTDGLAAAAILGNSMEEMAQATGEAVAARVREALRKAAGLRPGVEPN